MTVMTESLLIPPYGGRLVNLVVSDQVRDELIAFANRLPSLQLSERAVCDLEMLATGAFSPLDRFMGKEDYQRVLHEMRLANGQVFPIPITLPVEPGEAIGQAKHIALRNAKNELLAVMAIEEIYEWRTEELAQMVLSTPDLHHLLVSEMQQRGRVNISGQLQVLNLPKHYDFQYLRLTPRQTRLKLEEFGRKNVVAFQTHNPLHRVHVELSKRATQEVDGVLLLHPVVGMTKPGDVNHYTRVCTYRALEERYYDPDRILLALLPLAMRSAGPREELWHALIERNFGANHLIVGRDHTGYSTGKPFYSPYEGQELVERFSEELGVKMIPFRELGYMPEKERYEEDSKIPQDVQISSISGTQVREEYLNNGKPLLDWFTRPEVAQILGESYPPRHRQGVCVWFTGLSGAGKSTTAEILTGLLLERGRRVSVLDGDVVRTHLSKGLGFSKEDRDINIRRIGFVASEIVGHGGVVICAAVSPYLATRNDVRNMVGKDHFVEVFVDTPLEVCEQRDVKGMYAKARRGEIKDFTGIDDPYEPPHDAEIILDTVKHGPEENARVVLNYLIEMGVVGHLMALCHEDFVHQ
jgi:sulfate adenylyltransferase